MDVIARSIMIYMSSFVGDGWIDTQHHFRIEINSHEAGFQEMVNIVYVAIIMSTIYVCIHIKFNQIKWHLVSFWDWGHLFSSLWLKGFPSLRWFSLHWLVVNPDLICVGWSCSMCRQPCGQFDVTVELRAEVLLLISFSSPSISF